MIIKICGIKSFDIAQYAVQQGACMIGLVVNVEASPRNLSIEAAKNLIRQIMSLGTMKPKIVIVSKVKNLEEYEELALNIHDADYFQIHAQKPYLFYHECKNTENRSLISKLIIVLNKEMDSRILFSLLNDPVFDNNYFIIDSSEGQNTPFDLNFVINLIAKYPNKKILVSGGINSKNVVNLRAIRGIYGIDLSSGVEKTKGEKSMELIKEFFEEIRSCGLL
jgi:phosphoribosylanthranilate isomerase